MQRVSSTMIDWTKLISVRFLFATLFLLFGAFNSVQAVSPTKLYTSWLYGPNFGLYSSAASLCSASFGRNSSGKQGVLINNGFGAGTASCGDNPGALTIRTEIVNNGVTGNSCMETVNELPIIISYYPKSSTVYGICGGMGQSSAFDGANAGWYCPPPYRQTGNTCGSSLNAPDPNLNKAGCGCGATGDPINALVGNEYEEERDYTGEGPFPIVVERMYNSFGMGPGSPAGLVAAEGSTTWTLFSGDPNSGGGGNELIPPAGTYTNLPIDFGWRFSYDRALITSAGTPPTATLYRSDSKTRTFTFANGAWVPDPGQLTTSLTQQTDATGKLLGYTYVNEHDETERYDPSGKLLSITNLAGLTQTLQYDSVQNVLVSVTDPFGRQLTLTYNSYGLLSGMTDPNGGAYTYSYSTDGNNNLSMVTYPDGHTHQYLYENAQFVHALTGLIDENGDRFATWSYDANGSANMSEHAGGVEHLSLTYPSLTTSIATDVSGAVRTYTSQVINGIAKAGSVVETCGSNCSRTLSIKYDANGNVAYRADYNGNVTTYTFDLTRDLEVSRTEAAGTAQARTITTQWHPTFRLPQVITEPGRITTNQYDANGNLLTKTIAAGSSRTWTYTYNANGQIHTVTGPRSDVADVTTYAYDNSGNLISVTNALGQVTTLSNYDQNGRVGLITDPNSATTALTYAPRGWLTNKVVTAGSTIQSTTYSYDNAGQLKQVTLPDNSSVSYTYDPAHRLTNIQDSLGNSINYKLDLMDNRVLETVTDPSGVLTRQITRIFDSINRLQQVTGAAQ